MSDDTFFRFPLRALAAFSTPLERMENLVGYCVIDVGCKLAEERLGDADDLDEVWKMGCGCLNVRSFGKGAAKRCQKQYDTVVAACGDEPQATVTVATRFLWNCIERLRGNAERRPVSYREFSVLCAILSKIGDKELASCSWKEIQRRALGYVNEAEMTKGLPKRTDGAKPLSRQQVRDTVATLDRLGFFARFTVGNGTASFQTYYSIRMNPMMLAEAATRDFVNKNKNKNKRMRQGPGMKALQAEMWQKFGRG